MEKKTNIQELYESLVINHKRLILFGIGYQVQYCISRINLCLKIVCDNWETPYYLTDSGKYAYAFDNIVNYVDLAIDNNDTKLAKGYIDLEGKKIPVHSMDILNRLNMDNYIVLITTEHYEIDIKRQISNIDKLNKIEYYGFFSDLQHYERKNRGLIAERIIIPYMELIRQPYYQKNRKLTDADEYNRLIEYVGAGKYVNNVIGFEIATVCNLSCENCADYIPKLKRHEYIPTEIVLEDITAFFEVVDLVFCVTLVSGEVLFHPGIKRILNKLLSIDKVERIDLVTNGVRYPEDEELLQTLANNKIMLHMSNYNMPEITDISRKVYMEYGIDIRFMDEQVSWKRVNPVIYDRKLDNKELEKIYLKCDVARSCPQIVKEGKIYSCGRAIRYKELSEYDSMHDYFDIHNGNIELKRALLNLKLEPYLDVCNWCDWADEKSIYVRPGEQGHKDE